MKCIDQLIHNEYLFSTLKASLLKEKSMNEHFFLSILLKVNFRMFTIYSGTCILFSFNSRFMVSPNKQIFIVKHHFCWILNLCLRWFWQWQFLFSEVKVFIKENKKVKALRLLALRVAAHLKWNLNIILTG